MLKTNTDAIEKMRQALTVEPGNSAGCGASASTN